MGKKVQEMLDNANQRVPKVEVNQAMEWMNDGNTVFVDVRSKDAVRDSGLVCLLYTSPSPRDPL